MTFGAKNISASIHKFTVYDILFQDKLFIENNLERENTASASFKVARDQESLAQSSELASCNKS